MKSPLVKLWCGHTGCTWLAGDVLDSDTGRLIWVGFRKIRPAGVSPEDYPENALPEDYPRFGLTPEWLASRSRLARRSRGESSRRKVVPLVPMFLDEAPEEWSIDCPTHGELTVSKEEILAAVKILREFPDKRRPAGLALR